jgi:hypothetical protein
MKNLYQVLHSFRVGAEQRWVHPKDEIELLPCEAQYAEDRGWIKAIPTKTAAKKRADKSTTEDT